jgi:hypothetical protein
VSEKLAPIEVDPEDKSVRAFFTRARNAALRGITQDIHADIAHDDKLTEVRTAGSILGWLRRNTHVASAVASSLLDSTSSQRCAQ